MFTNNRVNLNKKDSLDPSWGTSIDLEVIQYLSYCQCLAITKQREKKRMGNFT